MGFTHRFLTRLAPMGGEISVLCPTITPTLGAELLSNGNMETGDPPDDWGAGSATLSAAADERTGGAGVQSLDIARNGGNFATAHQDTTVALGDWIYLSAWRRNVDALRIATAVRDGILGAYTVDAIYHDGVDWASFVATGGMATNTTQQMRIIVNCTGLLDGVSARADDISVRVISFSSATAYVGKRKPLAGVYRCHPTVTQYTQCGMLIHYADANNFVMALVDREKNTARLISRIGGTYAAVGSGGIAYGAGDELRVEVDTAGNYSLYYDDVQEVAPAAIAQATLGYQVHGFNTYDGNTVGQVRTSKN